MNARLAISLAVLACLLATFAGTAHSQETASGTIGTIERLDPAFDKLIPPDAKLEKLASGFDWSEGPVWMPEAKALLFSDVPMNKVYRWKDGEGLSVFLQPSGYTSDTPRGGEPGSNGLLRDPSGALVLMQHGDRRVARLKPDKSFETLADEYAGKRFNSPNDGAFKSNGDLYFTDPPYGLLKLNDDPAKEQPHNGVYRLSRDGKVTLLTTELTFPNGIAFSPDEKTLYVANSDPKKAIWKAFPVRDDGTLGEGRVLLDATLLVATKKGLPDGMKVDRAGNLFATGPGGVLVISSAGRLLGILDTGEATANCGWGDDGTTLYITADMHLCRIKTTTKGNGF
jgi:gluconolactonase